MGIASFVFRRRLACLLMVVFAIPVLSAGCGGGDSSAGDSSGASTTGDASETPAAAPEMSGMMPPAMAPDSSGTSGGGQSAMPAMNNGMPPGYSGYQPGMSSSEGPPTMPDGAGYSGAPAYADGAPGLPNASFGGPTAVPRPDNFASWTDENFLDALREKDSRLLDAIDSRVKSAPGDPKVADLLSSLLLASASLPDNVGSNQTGMNPSGMPSDYPGAMGASGGSAMPTEGSRNSRMPGSANSGGLAPPAGAAPASPNSGAMSPGNSSLQMPPQTQSLLEAPRGRTLAIDSLTLMFAESATAYFQSPAVGAMTRKGPAVGGDSSGTGAPGEYVPPGYSPPGGGGSADASGSAMPGYPGAEYQGGGYPGGSPQVSGSLDKVQLVEHIVDGLIQNGTPGAWQTLYGITAQTVETPLWPSEAARIVVRGLYSHIDRNPSMIEPIILSLLDGSAQVPADSRAGALKVTAAVCDLVADRFTGMAVPSGAQTVAGTAQNMAMGLGMPGGSSMMPPGMEMSGEGMPGLPMAGGAALGQTEYAELTSEAPKLSETALMHAAGFLWGPKCTDSLVKQLNSAGDLEFGGDIPGGGDIVRIAASVPNDRVRNALFALFTKMFASGPGGLSGGGMFKSAVHDPGMLVILKSLPRTKPGRSTADQAVPLDPWTHASQDLVLSLRDRLRSLSMVPGKLTPTGDSFPVRFHKNAVAEVAGVLTLPGTLGAGLKDSAPSATKVYYARLTFNPQREKDQNELADHYESRTSGVRRADASRGVLWMDGVKGTQTGTKRTMDVIIQAASGSGQGGGFGSPDGGMASGMTRGVGIGGGGGAAGGAFSVEIIVVETKDPKNATGEVGQASTKP